MSEPIIVHVDSQVLNSMDFCWQRYIYEHKQHWRPNSKGPGIEHGSVMHKMLAHYYTERAASPLGHARTRDDQQNELIQECLMLGRMASAQTKHISAEEFQEDIRVFQDYVTKYQKDGWEVVDVERPFSKPLFESEKLVIIYEGIVDLIVKDPKIGLAVVDHKTESRRSNPYVLSNQFQGYEWAFGIPVIVNKIGYQKKPKKSRKTGKLYPDDHMRRLHMLSGETGLKEWREDAIRRVVEAIGWWKADDDGKRVPKNRTGCDKYGGCIFQVVCKEPEEVRHFKLTVNFYKDKPWSVYDRDEVAEIG